MTAIVRQRGQLTIPDKVRSVSAWLKEGAVVGIEIQKEKIIIKPHQSARENEAYWNTVWQHIALARSFKGKKGNLSRMIAEDREDH